MKREFKVARKFAKRVGAIAGAGVIALTIWVGLGGQLGAAPRVPDAVTCLPTCTIDARHFVVAGDDPTTLSAEAITIGLNYTPGEPVVNFEIFDADRGTNWDTVLNCGAGCAFTGSPAPELALSLYVDPAGDGTGANNPANLIATWTPGGVVAGVEQGPFAATNNTWSGDTVPHDLAATGGDGNFHYALVISPFDPSNNRGWNTFKIRAEGTVTLLGNQIVGFIGAMNASTTDLNTVYPAFPTLTPTIYNGAWVFPTTLPPFLSDVTIFDGDMDYGNIACTYNDTDDPDTSNAAVPPFAVGSAAVPEGVAVATNPDPGNPGTLPCQPGPGTRTSTPADDANSAATVRTPTSGPPNGIIYRLRAPDGQVFDNLNPSGNKEWEQFKIQRVNRLIDVPGGILCPAGGFAESPGFTLPDDPNDFLYPASDCRTTVMPGGNWQVEVDGMDMQNLNFWFFSFKVEVPVTEYSIGRRVWFDTNGDGNEDAGEPGAVGVAYTVTVFDSPGGVPPDGTVVRTGLTGVDGLISETGLPAGNYTVTVDASNFDPGGVLEGYTSTTGGEVVSGVEVGLPVCTDTNVPAGCGLPVHADAIFGYDIPETNGRNSLTTGTCQQYVAGTLAEANEMEYGLSNGNISGVTPGGLMYWATVTVGAGEAVTVVQSRTGAGAGPLLIHGGNQARLLTTSCGVVTGWTGTQNTTTGTISFPAVPPGTYIVHVKWNPKSLNGTPMPVPDSIAYTFMVALNGTAVPSTANDPALALVKK